MNPCKFGACNKLKGNFIALININYVMKQNNFNFFLCPNCKSDKLNLFILKENSFEIKEGNITCNNCNKKYAISDGIIELILPDSEITKEKNFYLNEMNHNLKNDPYFTENNDAFILSLPKPTSKLTNRRFVIDYFIKQGQNFSFILKQLKINKDYVILDIGAGKCWTSTEFASLGCKVFAIDIIKEKYLGLKTAEIYINNKDIFFERICANMANLPFKEKTFDIVFFNSSFHHNHNINKTISEAVRVLKDDGKIILCNEPVKGIFRPHKQHRDLKKHGLNENTYFIWEYKKIFSKYKIKFKTFFPDSLDIKLKNWAENKNILYKILGNLYLYVFSKFADLKIMKTLLHTLFGMGLNLIGEKYNLKNEGKK
ncbi:MAG: class I SAM-dependent methyltransferase [Armatimonadetes bacterium]|nr:class I SAM-dependent methyltransferase [Armatimonadota bacterium]